MKTAVLLILGALAYMVQAQSKYYWLSQYIHLCVEYSVPAANWDYIVCTVSVRRYTYACKQTDAGLRMKDTSGMCDD